MTASQSLLKTVASAFCAVSVLMLLVGSVNAQEPDPSQPPADSTLTDTCVAKSLFGGRTVGKYCTVEPRIIGTRLSCIPFDRAPAGTCIVHYCDPLTGTCADTSLASFESLENTFNTTLQNYPSVSSSLLNNMTGQSAQSFGGFGGFFQNLQNLFGPLFGSPGSLDACPGGLCYSVGIRG